MEIELKNVSIDGVGVRLTTINNLKHLDNFYREIVIACKIFAEEDRIGLKNPTEVWTEVIHAVQSSNEELIVGQAFDPLLPPKHKFLGFMIVSVYNISGGGKRFDVTHTYIVKGAPSNLLGEAYKALKEIASQLGCQTLSFTSPFEGRRSAALIRRLRDYSIRPTSIRFEREV